MSLTPNSEATPLLPPTPPVLPESPASSTPAAATNLPPAQNGPQGERERTHKWQKWDDIYVTKIADELTFVRVQSDPALAAVVGSYYSMPARQDWTVQALEEVERQTRPRATARVHTTESELANCIRTDLHKASDAEGMYTDLVRRLRRYGKGIVVARPEREHPLWRSVMMQLKSGKMPLPSPLVTYTVHTTAFTDYDHTYCGVVMVGIGSIIVHKRKVEGDDLVEAELNMMSWVIETSGGGGRIDVHHSSDGAMRIWEQADQLGSMQGADTLGQQGTKLRELMRAITRQRTSVQVCRRPQDLFSEFARTAAASAFIGTELV